MNAPNLKLFLVAGLLAAGLVQPFAAQLRLSDGTPGGTVIITDQGPGDSNPAPGWIAYVGPVGSKWYLDVTIGVTKPGYGSASAPFMDLDTSSSSSMAAGLTIDFTETNFTAGGNVIAAVGGNTDGSVTYTAWADPGNNLFGQSVLLTTIGPVTGSGFTGSASTTLHATGPYSLTLETVIAHPSKGHTGFDAELSITPPPPTISCPPTVTVQCASEVPAPATDYASFVAQGGSASSLSGPVTVTFLGDVLSSSNCPNQFTLSRTYQATDASTNSATCSQTITAGDTIAPIITYVPPGGPLGCNPPTPPDDATVQAQVIAIDNCSVAATNVSHVDVTTGCGVTRTFTVTAVDACNNASAASNVVYTWTVDTTPPVVTVPAGGNLGCNPTLPTVASVAAQVRATDTCGALTTNITCQDATSGCGTTRTFTVVATDACGNSATNTVVYAWTADTTPPVITCPPNYTNSSAHAICGCTQGGWGAPPHGNNMGVLLANYCSTVYPRGCVEVGMPGFGGHSMKFTSAAAIAAYLPAGSTPGALTSDALNPTSSSAGVFGGQVLALQLNVDFCDAGLTGSPGSPLGDMMLNDATSPLNGQTVRQILALANRALGGGNVSAQGVTINTLNTLIDNLNGAFDNCQASGWAATHLLPTSGAPTLAQTGTATATDNCDAHPVVTYSDVVTPGGCAGSTVITRTWQAVDACGNRSTCTQIISLGASAAGVCGTVARDCAADGNLSGDTGLPGVTVTLKNGGSVVATTQTDTNGNYCFNNLPAGTYTVVVTPPANYRQTVPARCLNNNQITVCLAACQSTNGVNFGYTGAAPAVWLVKTGPATANCGQTITYTFAVTNTGNTCLYGGLQVLDPMFGGEIFHQTPVLPGQGFVFTARYVVKATDPPSLVNTALAVGHPPTGNPVTSSATWTVQVAPCARPLTLACPASCGQVGVPYASALVASGGTPPYSYSIRSGSLPPGLKLNANTGAITGTPTSPGVFSFTAQVNDSINADTVGCSISISSLRSPWRRCDVGCVGAPGSGGCAGGSYTVCGSGAGTSGTADGFDYVYQSASGDCSIVARVAGVEATDPWAEAGVMIRETLNANACHASLFVTPGKGVAFQCRTSSGQNGLNVNNPALAAPYWVKVVRRGNTFTSYCSPNGATWTQCGSQTIPMGANVYIGLSVTGHQDGRLCTATFDNVTVTPSGTDH